MLCDELAVDGASASGTDVSGVINRIKAAHKFVLGAEFAAVADALSEDYSGLVRAFEHCRLPYSQVWLECAQGDRPRFCAAPIDAEGFQMRPRRVGFLLSATRDDLSAWKAHLLWSLPTGQTSAAGMAMKFDMTHPIGEQPTVLEDERAYEAARRQRTWAMSREAPAHPGWTGASDSVKLTMIRHAAPARADYHMPLPIGVPQDRWKEFYDVMIDLARSDWSGEPAFLLAVVALLNARNAVETVVSDFTRLNKARAKRGVPPLFEHKVLRIAHRQVKRVYPEGVRQGDHAPMRGHFVRGHFKARKSGVFFWTPHARGDFNRGKIEKEYQL